MTVPLTINQTVAVLPIAGGAFTLIDASDWEKANQFRWRKHPNGGGQEYAARRYRSGGKMRVMYLHRFLCGARPGEVVDHENKNGLDNRRRNHRICTQAENCCNQKLRGGRSRFHGVNHDPRPNAIKKPWLARIRHGAGKRLNVGSFATEEEAARAYDEAAVRLHGQFCTLNFPNTAH